MPTVDLTGIRRTWPVNLQRTPAHTPRLVCISAPTLEVAREKAGREWGRHFARIQVHEPVLEPSAAEIATAPAVQALLQTRWQNLPLPLRRRPGRGGALHHSHPDQEEQTVCGLEGTLPAPVPGRSPVCARCRSLAQTRSSLEQARAGLAHSVTAYRVTGQQSYLRPARPHYAAECYAAERATAALLTSLGAECTPTSASAERDQALQQEVFR